MESELLFTVLIGQHLLTDARAFGSHAFSLQGNADTALTAIMSHARERVDSVRLQRDIDYQCIDGWLAPTLLVEGLASDSGEERSVLVAAAKDGALVARLRTTTYQYLAIPCGEGCTRVRVPFSAATRVRWERAAALPGTIADIDSDAPQRYLGARETRVTQRIRAALPPEVVLQSVTAHADGWRVSIDLRDRAILVPLLKQLNDTPDIADARVERRYESLNLEGSWREVLWLRVTSR